MVTEPGVCRIMIPALYPANIGRGIWAAHAGRTRDAREDDLLPFQLGHIFAFKRLERCAVEIRPGTLEIRLTIRRSLRPRRRARTAVLRGFSDGCEPDGHHN